MDHLHVKKASPVEHLAIDFFVWSDRRVGSRGWICYCEGDRRKVLLSRRKMSKSRRCYSEEYDVVAGFARRSACSSKPIPVCSWKRNKFREQVELEASTRVQQAFSLCRDKDPWW